MNCSRNEYEVNVSSHQRPFFELWHRVLFFVTTVIFTLSLVGPMFFRDQLLRWFGFSLPVLLLLVVAYGVFRNKLRLSSWHVLLVPAAWMMLIVDLTFILSSALA